MLTESERRAYMIVRVLLFGGMLDGHQIDIVLDEDGEPPLERSFIGFGMCRAPYRLAARRPDGVCVYVPLYG